MEFENFVQTSDFGSFTQSENWAKLKSSWKSEKITVNDENGNISGAMLVLIKKVPFLHTSFMYAPRGPVCDISDTDTLRKLLEKTKSVAEKYHSFMLKIDPMIESDDKKSMDILKSLNLHYTGDLSDDNTIQSRSNYVLDIKGKSKEEIFSNFHSKWRYNIRLAQRKGVSCRYYGCEKIDEFYTLLSETGQRDGFCIRSKAYLKDMLNAFGDNARLYMCYSEDGIPLSGALSIKYGKRVSYVYGASSSQYRNLMPNYLMQWEMMQWAIESNCNIYDFMGIPHYDDESHPNYGVYRFKKGFNGRVAKYAGEFDYIFMPRKTKIIKKLLHLCGYNKL